VTRFVQHNSGADDGFSVPTASSRSACQDDPANSSGTRRFRAGSGKAYRPANAALRSASANPYHGLGAVTSQAQLDARHIRADFPIFEQLIHVSLSPPRLRGTRKIRARCSRDDELLLDVIRANVHRGVYFSRRARDGRARVSARESSRAS